jgi:HlyD family secretion protein
LFAAIGLLLLLSAVGVGTWLLQQRGTSAESVSGTIETDEVRVASRYGGRVEHIFAQEGDMLRPGQIIVELEASELEARRDQAAALLAEWEAGPRREEIEAARHDWESVTAELEFARSEDKRMRELFTQKAVSETDRDRAVSRLHSLERSSAAAKARYDLLIAGTRPEKIAQGRAQLQEIESQLREMKITAPTNCVLEVLQVKVGDVLSPNRDVATLLLTDQLWVRVYVPATWLGWIQLGQKVRVRVDSFPDREFGGIVEQISRNAEFTPRNVQTVADRVRQVFGVKVRLVNEQDALRAGMSADVYFPNAPAPRLDSR